MTDPLGMADAARLACLACGYGNAGTVEFLLDTEGRFFFIEMNTRLQVEHPVSELVTGVDIACQQLLLAGGGDLPRRASPAPRPRDRVSNQLRGPGRFQPAAGTVTRFRPPLGPACGWTPMPTRATACRRSTTRCWPR